MVIPCGTTTFTQLSRLDTDPADLLHPVSDVRLLPPAGFATGLVASHCPWKDLHLLDNFNRFHRGRHPRIPAVTGLTRHDTPWFGWGAPTPRCCHRGIVPPGARSTTPLRSPAHTYWITSSAWKRSVGGMVRPSALAVLRLRTNSNFIGCSIGRSPGLAPLRILST